MAVSALAIASYARIASSVESKRSVIRHGATRVEIAPVAGAETSEVAVGAADDEVVDEEVVEAVVAPDVSVADVDSVLAAVAAAALACDPADK